MTPLWNWETCLPVDRAVIPAPDSASIKAKTPAIVHHQGSSRQTMKILNNRPERQRRDLIPAYGNAIGNAPHLPPSPVGAPHPIKAKNPLIVHNQGSSRQYGKFPESAPPRAQQRPIPPTASPHTHRVGHRPFSRPSPICVYPRPSAVHLPVPRSSHPIPPQSRQKPL